MNFSSTPQRGRLIYLEIWKKKYFLQQQQKKEKKLNAVTSLVTNIGRHDIQHNDTQHKGLIWDIQYK
jgi:hypothetical protein